MVCAPTDDRVHPDAGVEEWVFAAWSDDGRTGALSGHRLNTRGAGDGRVKSRRAWYWAALVDEGRPLLHLADWDVPVRPDPFVVKGPELWAEHDCVEPMEQWTVGNEASAVALDDADEALRRVHGTPTPIAFDLEWYATGPPTEIPDGYEQPGVVHGEIEVLRRPPVVFVEAPAHRWHRWASARQLAPLELPGVVAHTGLRAPFAFPDDTSADWVLTRHGWRARSV